MIKDGAFLWSEEDGGNGGAAPAIGGGVAGWSISTSSEEKYENHHLMETHSFDSAAVAGDNNSDISPNRRIKTSQTTDDHDQHQFDEQEKLISSSLPPLGLKLRKSSSFVTFLESALSEKGDQQTDIHSLPIPEKMKAANFPAKVLRIGSWERACRYEGDLVAKCYYAKKKLVWEFLEKSLKRKIEIQWSDILGIRATGHDKQPGILEIELNQPPAFYHEIDPQPRKHTNWKVCSDFTDGQAPICRRHYLEFAPGVLDKHYEKLLQYDSRLYELSQQPFPHLKSSYFQSISYGNPTDFHLDNYNTNASQTLLHHQMSINPGLLHDLLSQTNDQQQQHRQRQYDQQIIHHHSTSPDSVMEFSHTNFTNDETARNQRMGIWGQGSSNDSDYPARNQQMAAIRGQEPSNGYNLDRDHVPGQMMINRASPTRSSIHYQSNNYIEENRWSDNTNMLLHEVNNQLWDEAEVEQLNMIDNQLWDRAQIEQPNVTNDQLWANVQIELSNMTYSLPRMPPSLGSNPLTNQTNYGQIFGIGTGMGLQFNGDTNWHPNCSPADQVSSENFSMELPQFSGNFDRHPHGFSCLQDTPVAIELQSTRLPQNYSQSYSMCQMTDNLELVNDNINGANNWPQYGN